jgi:hypothetical protein
MREGTICRKRSNPLFQRESLSFTYQWSDAMASTYVQTLSPRLFIPLSLRSIAAQTLTTSGLIISIPPPADSEWLNMTPGSQVVFIQACWYTARQ